LASLHLSDLPRVAILKHRKVRLDGFLNVEREAVPCGGREGFKAFANFGGRPECDGFAFHRPHFMTGQKKCKIIVDVFDVLN